MTGIQALVRLPLERRRRDERNGRNTGIFTPGDQGSPLGTYDIELERARKLLEQHGVVFQPALFVPARMRPRGTVRLACVGPRASTTPLPGGTTNTTGSNMQGYQ
ncbi:MAG: transporter [Mycobacterium sp.]|jgi:hypothetical protein|nr:transporter [Mycobacterium sp.]